MPNEDDKCFWVDDQTGERFYIEDLTTHYRETLYPWMQELATVRQGDGNATIMLNGKNLAALVAATMFHVEPFPTRNLAPAEEWLRWLLREWRPGVPTAWAIYLPIAYVEFLQPDNSVW